MRVKSVRFRCFIDYTPVTVLCLCICLLSSTVVRAQKTPPIFKTESGNKSSSTSATNMTYVNLLEAEYRANEMTNKERAKLIRNKLIYIGVEQTDAEFNNYRRRSRKRNDLLQFLFDFFEIAASTAIAITNSGRAKEVIAEALTGFKGSRTSFTKNFKLLEAQVLFNKMVANRSQRLNEIYKNLNADVVSYPWERARTELRTYFYAGTIDDALNTLSIDTGFEANQAEETLEETKRNAGIFGEPTPAERAESGNNFEKIRAILRVGVTADRALIAELQKPEASQDASKIAELEATKRAVLDDLKTIFDLIEADPQIQPFLDKIPEEFSRTNPGLKSQLEAALGNIRENKAELRDYDLILPKLSNLIATSLTKDPSLAGRLSTILSTSKTLQNQTP